MHGLVWPALGSMLTFFVRLHAEKVAALPTSALLDLQGANVIDLLANFD